MNVFSSITTHKRKVVIFIEVGDSLVVEITVYTIP